MESHYQNGKNGRKCRIMSAFHVTANRAKLFFSVGNLLAGKHKRKSDPILKRV